MPLNKKNLSAWALFTTLINSQWAIAGELPRAILTALGRDSRPSNIPTFENAPNDTSLQSARYVFTHVLNDAYSNAGTEGVQKAQRFSFTLSNQVDYTTQAMDTFVEMLEPISGTATLCLPDSPHDLVERCSAAFEFGDSVYIPFTKLLKDNLTISAASGGELNQIQKPEKEWLEAIRLLKRQIPKLRIYGLFVGRPDEILFHSILEEMRRVTDGIVIDSEYIPGACWTQVRTPPPNRNWMWFVHDVRYFVSNLDATDCTNGKGAAADKEPYLNTPQRTPEFPHFMTPIFPCYGGREWRCFDVIKEHPNEACSFKQRYAFSLYEITSAAVLKLLTTTCKERTGKVPPYDLIKTI